MLTSGGQYLSYPDYLDPLPSPMDSKQSPLALLAQTCSAIGKDPAPPSKGSDKKDGRDSKDGSKSLSPKSPKSADVKREDRSSVSPRSSSPRRDRKASPSTERSDFRSSLHQTALHKDLSRIVASCSPGPRSPPSIKEEPKEKRRDDDSRPISVPATSSSPPMPASMRPPTSPTSDSLGLSKPLTSSSSSLSRLSPLHAPRHGELPGHLPHPFYPGLSYLPGSLPPTSLASSHASLSALGLAAHKAHLPPHLSGAHPGHAPPFSYSYVKSASGATTLVPVCRDPYCTNCQISLHSAQLSPAGSACPAGCTQCDHAKSYPGISTSLPGTLPTSLPPSLSSSPSAGLSAHHLSSAQHLQSLYGHAFGVHPGHPGMPYICNWVAGSDYCGKRFTTSEELLHHLRTHTSSATSESALSAGLAAAYPGLAALSPAAALAAYHGPHAYPGALTGADALRHAYPRSLSPSSLLASRYHPYKSPFSSLPPSMPGAGLSPYAYSPYAALYGQRLGSAIVP